jgi:dTDP-4-amino-4,6-dideoxygalactose transaminase
MNIPFVDLKAQYLSIKGEIDGAIQSVIEESAFVRGRYVSQFEEEYAHEYGVEHCISCASGTDALYITLKALGIGPGDEVITTALSWISTSQTISQTGAQVVFVDIEKDYFTIDPMRIEEKITGQTRAIIPVHLYGQAADMSTIMSIAKKHNLVVVEDCAQAHFANFKSRTVGTFGIAGTFSFFPGKNLGAYGDAGAIISSDEKFSTRARMFANHGSLVKHQHQIEGINSRLDGIQAAVLLVKLKQIHKWNSQRRKHGLIYSEFLSDIEGVNPPLLRMYNEHVYHLYVIRTDNRDRLQEHLTTCGISSGIHYPTALPFLSAYEYLGHKPADFPIAHKYQSQILSLPMYPEMTKEMCEVVIKNVVEFYKQSSQTAG